MTQLQVGRDSRIQRVEGALQLQDVTEGDRQCQPVTEVLVAKWIQAGTEGAQQLQTETERSLLQASTEVAWRLQAERMELGGLCWDEGLGRKEGAWLLMLLLAWLLLL